MLCLQALVIFLVRRQATMRARALTNWVNGRAIFVKVIPARELHILNGNGGAGISNYAGDDRQAKLRHLNLPFLILSAIRRRLVSLRPYVAKDQRGQLCRPRFCYHDSFMKIATFNINNINRRLPNLLAWLRTAEPDVVAL